MQKNHHPRKWLILAAVACGTFMATLDSSIVNVALPSITAYFKTSLAFSRWVVIAYLFSISGLMLFFGRLADIIGRKVVFNLGFVIFTIGCAFCGMAGSVAELIFFRGAQGFGAAMIMANSPAIITSAFPSNERGKALGTLAMVVSAGLAIGPSLGGILVHYLNWQSIFLVNIPPAILGTILVHKYVPATLGITGTPEEIAIVERERLLPTFARIQVIIGKLRYFDWLGALMWVFIQLGYSLAIDRENVLGLAGPLQRLISFGSVGLFALFLLWESSIKDPVLDLSLFRSRIFLLSNLSAIFNFIALSSVTLLMPFYLQNVRNLAPGEVGMFMTAIPLTIFVVAPISGRLSDKYGAKILSSVGLAVICIGLVLLSLPHFGLVTGTAYQLVLSLIMVGFGTGMFQSPNNNAIMGAVPKSHLGVASALLATIRNIGLVSGAALSTTLLMHYYGLQLRKLGPDSSPTLNFITAMRYTFITLSAVCAIGIVVSLIRGRTQPEVSHAKKD